MKFGILLIKIIFLDAPGVKFLSTVYYYVLQACSNTYYVYVQVHFFPQKIFGKNFSFFYWEW